MLTNPSPWPRFKDIMALEGGRRNQITRPTNHPMDLRKSLHHTICGGLDRTHLYEWDQAELSHGPIATEYSQISTASDLEER